jgi:hypothetical protein
VHYQLSKQESVDRARARLEQIHNSRIYRRLANELGPTLQNLWRIIPAGHPMKAKMVKHNISLLFAPGEADIEIARLIQTDPSKTVLSTDADYVLGFLNRVPNMVRVVPRQKYLQFFEKTRVCRKLGFSSLAQLLVCHFLQNKNDYTTSIQGVGFVTAVKLVKSVVGLNLEATTTSCTSFLAAMFLGKEWKSLVKRNDWSSGRVEEVQSLLLSEILIFLEIELDLLEGDDATELTDQEIDQYLIASVGGLGAIRDRVEEKLYQYRERAQLPCKTCVISNN